MARRHRRLIASLFTVLLLGGTACSDTGETGAPDVVEGVLLDVDSAGIGDIRGFTIKDGDDIYDVVIDPDTDLGFDLGHLQEHLAGSLPVIVELEERDGALFATSIEDA